MSQMLDTSEHTDFPVTGLVADHTDSVTGVIPGMEAAGTIAHTAADSAWTPQVVRPPFARLSAQSVRPDVAPAD